MFLFLIGAIIAKVIGQRNQPDEPWFWTYSVIGALMIVGGIVIPATRVFGDHTVFALEAYEIVLFAVYWSVQTAENWQEQVDGTPMAVAKPGS